MSLLQSILLRDQRWSLDLTYFLISNLLAVLLLSFLQNVLELAILSFSLLPFHSGLQNVIDSVSTY